MPEFTGEPTIDRANSMIDQALYAEEQIDGSVALFTVEPDALNITDRYHGFLFDQQNAIQTALCLFAAAYRAGGCCTSAMALTHADYGILESNEETFARMTLRIRDANIPIKLTRLELAAMVAELSSLLRDLSYRELKKSC
jgi:hypothetical protein